MGKEKTELVPVYLEDRVTRKRVMHDQTPAIEEKQHIGVKTLIQANFPQLVAVNPSYSRRLQRHFKDIYEFTTSNKMGCGLSIKVPSEAQTAGKALHLTAKLYNPHFTDDIAVYPKSTTAQTKYGGEKLGRGHFTSKSINRDANWKKNMMIEAITGMGICQTMYEQGFSISDTVKQEIYNLYSTRNDLKHTEIKKAKICKELTKESSKQKCKAELKDIQNKIDNLTDIIDRQYHHKKQSLNIPN